MKINSLKITLIAFAMCLFASCNDTADFGEQYRKIIYLVNGEGMLTVGEHEYATEEVNMLRISVYCGSSEPITEDVTVKLMLDPDALDSLNTLYALSNKLYIDKQMLPESNYSIESYNVTIKAGTQYATLDIPLDPEGLDPDVPYVLPLSIVSNSANYEINKELETLIYEIKMVNGFAGYYSGRSIETADRNIRPVQPQMQAISAYEVRMPIHNKTNDLLNLDTDYMVLTIGSDSTTVTIRAWGDAVITDLGRSTYDKKREEFQLFYSFKDGEETLEIDELIRDVEANLEDDEDEI